MSTQNELAESFNKKGLPQQNSMKIPYCIENAVVSEACIIARLKYLIKKENKINQVDR